MPGPVTHIVCAQKVWASLAPEPNKAEFIIGTVFPDIRMLKVIDREKTHLAGVTYKQIQAERDSFRCGLLLHALIDVVREDYVRSRGVYKGLPEGYLTTVALKLCEDMLLYDKINSWPEYIECLRTVLPQEEEFGIPVSAIRSWHRIHSAFLAAPPNENLVTFLQAIGLPRDGIGELMDLIATVRERKLADTYIYDFYDELEGLLEGWKNDN